MNSLPPGQIATDAFPRFGLTPFAERFPKQVQVIELDICGDVAASISVGEPLQRLPRVEQVADFHCVTTWTRRALRWSGFRFADFYEEIVVPMARPHPQATFVVLRCQDGFRARMSLADLLAADVMLADRLDDEPLTIEHGAPLRLVAPAHYGYKSAKHLDRIEFWCDDRKFRPPGLRFMEHPRGRVALEERGQWIPGIVLRYLYRPLIGSTAARFRRALDVHLHHHPPGR